MSLPWRYSFRTFTARFLTGKLNLDVSGCLGLKRILAYFCLACTVECENKFRIIMPTDMKSENILPLE